MIRYAFFITLLAGATASTHAEKNARPSLPDAATLATIESLDAAALRKRGPQSLELLFAGRDEIVEQLKQASTAERGQELRSRLAKLDRVIDEVGGQRYCSASRLYWHTDIEKAKAAAAESGKPILSLRLMGQLTDELSCANSRFFRTTLYANNEVSDYLRNRFVLHWKSVRPVPRVTIDFGDGRKLVRTLTGNSAHYVLAPDGRPLDVLPGLYAPAKFLSLLKEAEAAVELLGQAEAKASPGDRDQVRTAVLYNYHNGRIAALLDAWENDLRRAKVEMARPEPGSPNEAAAALRAAAPPAEAAAVVARPKAMVELNVIRMVTMRTAPLEQQTDEAMWKAIAALHYQDARLDDASVELIRIQNGGRARDASRLAITKAKVEDPMLRMLANFQSSVALDTVRNEYLLHRKIHEWFIQGEASDDVDQLNERVYAELFLTPSSDPWIGLVDADTYTALENGGIEVNQ